MTTTYELYLPDPPPTARREPIPATNPSAFSTMASRNLPDISTVSEWIDATGLPAEADRLAAAFRPIGIAARRAAAALEPLALEPLARLIIEADRGPTIGRKRRARRARRASSRA